MSETKYYCNPLNISYQYQFNKQPDGSLTASREAADPSMILFKGTYFLFPSMTCGFLYSQDMVSWQFHATPELPVYDYAPDVRAAGDYLYFCASNHEKGVYYRTKDPFTDQYERIEGQFPFWDPNLFVDEDGRIYFFWGSSTTEPLYGIELNPADMSPIGERRELVYADTGLKGFERNGENHIPERSPEEIAAALAALDNNPAMPGSIKAAARAYISCAPYIEGVWVNRHGDTYYLQYGTPSSSHNIYSDAVYTSKSPLGPYSLAPSNPFSYKPGGYLPGAGHGSTMEDRFDNLWHISTSRICINHNFERRLGLWPAGWDRDGDLFCNQRYGDWPVAVAQSQMDPWAAPEWMLLSYGKSASASSFAEGKEPCHIADENILTFWKAASSHSGEWVLLDLLKEYDVHAIQVNFADDQLPAVLPAGASLTGALHQERWIDQVHQPTRWLLEAAGEDQQFTVVEDKRQTDTDLPHDLVVREKGFQARYLKLTVYSLPYGQAACVSGLRVFGLAHDQKPLAAQKVSAVRKSPLDAEIAWEGNAAGYVVVWGYAPDKLYHSYQVFDNKVSIGGLIRDQKIYFRVDSWNESGITQGDCIVELD